MSKNSNSKKTPIIVNSNRGNASNQEKKADTPKHGINQNQGGIDEVSLLEVKECDLIIEAMQLRGILCNIPKLNALVEAGVLPASPAPFFTKIKKGTKWFYVYLDTNYNWIRPTTEDDIDTITTALNGLNIDIFFDAANPKPDMDLEDTSENEVPDSTEPIKNTLEDKPKIQAAPDTGAPFSLPDFMVNKDKASKASVWGL